MTLRMITPEGNLQTWHGNWSGLIASDSTYLHLLLTRNQPFFYGWAWLIAHTRPIWTRKGDP